MVQGRDTSIRDASSKGRIDQGTHRPRDAPSRGRIVQGTHRPRDASSKGRIVQETHRSRDETSENYRPGKHRSGKSLYFLPHHSLDIQNWSLVKNTFYDVPLQSTYVHILNTVYSIQHRYILQVLKIRSVLLCLCDDGFQGIWIEVAIARSSFVTWTYFHRGQQKVWLWFFSTTRIV